MNTNSLKQVIYKVSIIAIALITCLTIQAQEEWQYFSKETFLVGRLNANDFRRNPVIDELSQQSTYKLNVVKDQLYEFLGLDLDTVRTIWIGVEGDDRATIILKGQYDVESIRDIVYKIDTMEIVAAPSASLAFNMPDDKKPGKTNMAAFIDDETLAFGNPEVTEKFLQNLLEGSKHADVARIAPIFKSKHMLHAMLLKMPPKNDFPEFVRNNFKDAELIVNAPGDMMMELYLHPVNKNFIPALKNMADGFLGIYRELPDENRPKAPGKRIIMENISIATDDKAIIVKSMIPEKPLRNVLAAKLVGNPL